jgi:hypothetical protein
MRVDACAQDHGMLAAFVFDRINGLVQARHLFNLE